MSSTVYIETPRLLIRDFREDDFASVHNYASDPEVSRFMTWGPNTEDDTHKFIQLKLELQGIHPRTDFDCAVELKTEKRVIGSCGIRIALTPSEASSASGAISLKERLQAGGNDGPYTLDHKASMGYCFGKDVWGKGYASEAAKALLKFGFDDLHFHKIFATCDVNNIASAKVLEKSGMKREGCHRQDVYIKGFWRDSYFYAILKHEWNLLKQQG